MRCIKQSALRVESTMRWRTKILRDGFLFYKQSGIFDCASEVGNNECRETHEKIESGE